eukprot:COSAG05_NODE_172_length_14980_cov_10.662791_10_plen_67_part_00
MMMRYWSGGRALVMRLEQAGWNTRDLEPTHWCSLIEKTKIQSESWIEKQSNTQIGRIREKRESRQC